MSNLNNYVLVRSLSRLRTDDVIVYFQGIVGEEDIIKEKTKLLNPNEIIFCFRNPNVAEKVLKKPVHQISLENGMILLLQVDKSFDKSLILPCTSQQNDHDNQDENSRNHDRIFSKSSAENIPLKYGNRLSEPNVKPKIYQVESEGKEMGNKFSLEKSSRKESRGSPSEASFSSRNSRKSSFNENSNFGLDNTCIEVTGINPKTDDSTLRLFFENSRRSGGGDIKIFTRKEDTTALVTFSKISVANSVLERRDLILDDSKLIVRKASIEDHKEIIPPYDNAKFLLSRIPTETSLRTVYDFVEYITERKSGYKLLKGKIPGVRLVSFEKKIDFLSILERGKSSKLKGQMYLSKIRRTSKIEIYGFPDDVSKDMLMLHFESTKNGGGDASSITIDEEYNVAIINFKDFKTVQEVTKLKHIMKDKQLKVCPYFDCIGYQLPVEKISDCICETEINPKIFNFIKNHQSSWERFKKLIEKNNCEQDLSYTDQSKLVLRKLPSSSVPTSIWKRTTNECISDFFLEFKCFYKQLSDKFNLVKQLYEMIPASENRIINIDDILKTVEIIGLKDAVDSTEISVRELSNAHIHEAVSLPAYQIRLLSKTIYEIKSDVVKVTSDQKKKQIILDGGRVFVMAALAELKKHISAIVSAEFSLPSYYSKVLETKPACQFVIDSFKNASIFIAFEFLQKDKIIIGSCKKDCIEQGLNIIKKSIKQSDIPLKEEFSGHNFYDKLKKFIKDISETHTGCVDIILQKDRILITAVCGLVDIVKKEIEEFLEKNYTSDAIFDLIPYNSLGKFFANSYKNEIMELEKKFHTSIQVSGFSKIFLKGSPQNIDLVTTALNKHIADIITEDYIIDKPEINIWFKDEHLEDCITAVKQKHSCWIKELEETKSQQQVSTKGVKSPLPLSPATKVAASNASGIQWQGSSSSTFYSNVQVKQGDITKEKVDAIVNGIYNNSIETGAISQAIIKAAGTSVKDEFSSAAQIYPFTITSGGNLPCSHIIHMQLNFGSNFKNDIIDCFKLSDKEGYRSIALPAFGTGNAGIKANDMSSQIFDAVKEYNQLVMNKTLKQILIVIFDSNLFKVFSDELSQRNSVSQNSSTQSNDIFSHNGLTVQLKTGDIFNEDVDIIVNSIDSSLNLSQAKGAVAKLLREKGGSQIVDECQNLGRTNSDGLASTTAGNLPFKHIIHFATNDATNLWDQRVTNCLTLADSLSASSIAMPVFGTGVGGLNTGAAANILLSGLLRFSRPKILKTVKIILFQSSMLPEFITIFQDSLNNAQNSATTSVMTNINPKPVIPQYPPKKFRLHAKDQPTLTKVKTEITLWLDNKIVTHEVLISNLVLDKSQEIYDIGKKEEVITVIDNTKIIVKGLAKKVSNAIVKLLQIITTAKEAETYAYKVQWYFRSTVNSNYIAVTNSNNYDLEVAFQKKSLTSFTFNNISCNIHSQLLKRKDLHDKTPLEWDNMTGNEAVIILDSNSVEYKNVSAPFIKSLGRTPTIIKISRIQNKSLYDQYRAQKEMLEKKNGFGFNNERILYHGTDGSCLGSINSTGFNRSLAGQNVGTAYGNGSYFALNASYSDGYARPNAASSEKNMYHCKILAGKITQGASGMITVPSGFDSLVNYTASPSIFVIFHDAGAYPEYLITYK